MADAHKNFAISAVATAPSPATSGTSLVVTAGQGTRFPAAPFNAVVCPANTTPDPTNAEVVRVTAIATDTLTIARAQEGSTARTIVAGDIVFAAVTTKTLTDIESPAELDLVTDWTTTTPALPTTGTTLFSRYRAGRRLPAFMPPSGLDSPLQPGFAFNKISMLSAPGGSSTAPTAWASPTFTVVGTGTARAVATTNFSTQTKRLAYVSAATAGSQASAKINVATLFISATALMGGFYVVIRWINDTNASTADRTFVGLTATTGALANADPSSLFNLCGMGADAGDTNFQFMYNDAAGACTKVDLGANFAKATLTNVYELRMFAKPGTAQLWWSADRLDISSALVEGNDTTNIPASNTLLTPNLHKWNNATAAACAFAFISLYIETDN